MQVFPGGSTPVIQLGAVQHPNNGSIFCLLGNIQAAASHCTPRLAMAAAGYTPRGGKTFRILGWVIKLNAAVTTQGGDLGYADTDIGMESAAAFVNPVSFIRNMSYNSPLALNQAVDNIGLSVGFPDTADAPTVPNAKYLYWSTGGTGGGGTIQIFGKEV